MFRLSILSFSLFINWFLYVIFFCVLCSLFIFPRAGPDIKYLLGFVRTQFSTTTTIALVFGPKISRVLKGHGDKWDQKAKVRSITASFSLNGVGLVPEESPDLYQENEELKVGLILKYKYFIFEKRV